jgi:hypothetical protein
MYRVGGNVQDLFTRVLCAVLGSVWGGLAYFAGNGNPCKFKRNHPIPEIVKMEVAQMTDIILHQ